MKLLPDKTKQLFCNSFPDIYINEADDVQGNSSNDHAVSAARKTQRVPGANSD